MTSRQESRHHQAPAGRCVWHLLLMRRRSGGLTLERHIYNEFADVLGEENLCDDPAMMAAYFKIDFGAVVMPKDTAQVQAVVRLCNRHKLQYRPVCTGWGEASSRARSCSTCGAWTGSSRSTRRTCTRWSSRT